MSNEDIAREIIEAVLQNANCPAIERDSIEDSQLSSYMKQLVARLDDKDEEIRVYEKAANEWMKDYDALKAKYEPLVASVNELLETVNTNRGSF